MLPVGGCSAPARERAHWIPAPHFFSLNQACATVNRAFDSLGCYLVGSSLERFFRTHDQWLNPLWSLMCTTISAWLSAQSGLPVDFQIQRQTQANERHGGPRAALGIFLDYPGERPSEVTP